MGDTPSTNPDRREADLTSAIDQALAAGHAPHWVIGVLTQSLLNSGADLSVTIRTLTTAPPVGAR